MKAVCAWCKKDIGPRDSPPGTEAAITHGICRDCLRRWFPKYSSSFKEFLDSLKVPILVIDQDGKVKTGNGLAEKVLNRHFSESEDIQLGEAFTCVNVRQPGDCGRSAHCPTCGIRKAIRQTFTTGKPMVCQPATIHRAPEKNSTDFLISTEKAGDMVLLRIDHMGDKSSHEKEHRP
jgi:hypothetical protein